MVCETRKIDSNVAGLSFAKEECLKELPSAPVWHEMDPNSYSDWGAEITTVQRETINSSRQKQKGRMTDLDASGGFNIDVLKSNLNELLEGFFFADTRENVSTSPLNGTSIAITAVDATEKQFEAASGLTRFTAGQLLLASGFTKPLNNGLFLVSTVAAGAITVVGTLADEVPTATAKLESVGIQLPSGDISATFAGGAFSLSATATDLTTIAGLYPGNWVFIGGDATALSFANNVGYARIKSITEDEIIFDDTTWSPVTEAGTGKTIQIFTCNSLKNEDKDLIKRKSFTFERTLGEDFDGTQAEYLRGSVCNELTINIPTADKVSADATFIACDVDYRTGAQGLYAGSRVGLSGGDFYNTTSDVYRIKMAIHDPANPNPAALFGYVQEATIAINNNATGNKAIGVLGNFEVTTGDFEVTGSVTAYFSTVEAVRAIRNNSDVSFNIINAFNNYGQIWDMPLISLGGGRISVTKDDPITIPLDTMAAESEFGHTLFYGFFPYLPDAAMPE
ncbi:major tail protein [Erwinia phage AH03]|uniref:Major tail protein n=1 Tax=Erwinia phage AH03 TaxID=2869568 RepID=A0AAE8BUH9_9CAUD|nr:major tail protein [Erwinia phage AH03]